LFFSPRFLPIFPPDSPLFLKYAPSFPRFFSVPLQLAFFPSISAQAGPSFAFFSHRFPFRSWSCLLAFFFFPLSSYFIFSGVLSSSLLIFHSLSPSFFSSKIFFSSPKLIKFNLPPLFDHVVDPSSLRFFNPDLGSPIRFFSFFFPLL